MALHGHSHDCGCPVGSSSVHQTLDEMEFERGIWSAVLSGQLQDVEKRLQAGDDINAKDKSGYTALHYAARGGSIDICALLLRNGCHANCVTNTGRVTPLHRAAYMGHAEIVKLLIRHGADASLQDADGMTALHKAAERGHSSVVSILVKAAPDSRQVRDLRGRLPADLCISDDLCTLLT